MIKFLSCHKFLNKEIFLNNGELVFFFWMILVIFTEKNVSFESLIKTCLIEEWRIKGGEINYESFFQIENIEFLIKPYFLTSFR